MAAALECFIYVVMALCVMRLRKRQPETERAFKIPLGFTISIITVVVFTGLMIGIFTDVSRDHTGRVIFENYWVAVIMADFFLFTTAYALLVVPYLKKKGAARASARVKRRPGRPE
jgi:amino acid transporter